MNTMSIRVPAGAGISRLVRENVMVRGRKARVGSIEFTTKDGFTGKVALSHNRGPREATVAAYQMAMEKRETARAVCPKSPEPVVLAWALS